MPKPYRHQVEGAKFLSDRNAAVLADEPRVGKTGAAILAGDDVWARRTLTVTTASGRPVWKRGFSDWSMFDPGTEVLYSGSVTGRHLEAPRLVIGWSKLPELLKAARAAGAEWDVLNIDESHYAKSLLAKRTQALFGEMSGTYRGTGLIDFCERKWCLTGTFLPNSPADAYPTLRALAPERLTTAWGPVDVTSYAAFERRYCITRVKHTSRFNKITVVVGGRNLDELKARLDGFILRRTQQDVGITKPIYDLLPIHLGAKQRREIEAAVPDAEEILAAAETGETKSIEMHLGTLRRVTGFIKAQGVVSAVVDDLEGGIDKIVVMAWHKETIAGIEGPLRRYGAVSVTGATTPKARDEAVERFKTDPACRVFVGQIVACGEAIDLSAAADLIFAETSFVPKDVAQAALRVTNHGQTRQPRVRVAALEGSIDEALQSILVRKVQTIKEVTA